MLITKEHQESMVEKYKNAGRNFDECIGFIDGMNAMLELVAKKMQQRAFVNVYSDGIGRFIGDKDYDSYEAAFEGRDQLSGYVETVAIIRNVKLQMLQNNRLLSH